MTRRPDIANAIRRWVACRRLAKMVALNRSAPATQSYAAHRAAALKSRRAGA